MPKYPYIVLSFDDDAHIPFVEKYLDQPFVRIDPAEIVRGVPLNISFLGNCAEVTWGAKKLNSVKGVWYRRPVIVKEQMPVQGDMAQYSIVALQNVIALLYGQFPDALWVSEFYAVQRASNKGLQMTLAHRLGFDVPETLVTSSALDAKAFIKKHGPTIAKLIRTHAIKVEGVRYMLLTHLVDEDTDFSGLRLAPVMLQQAILDGTDIRVTVVGDQVFAATIEGETIDVPDRRIRDWRITNDEGEAVISPVELPKKINELCKQYVLEQGLVFGAIDLILDKTGTYWFLENNPNGQWAFVEEATGQPIGKAFADLLMRGKQ